MWDELDDTPLGPLLRWFLPVYRFGAPTREMVWLERLRTVGMFGTYVVIAVYGTWGLSDVLPLLRQHVTDTLLGLPALLLGMVLIVVVARRGARRDAVRALGVPIGRIAVIAGGACCVLMIAAVVDDANSLEYHWTIDIVLFLVAAVLIIATVIGVPLALVILFLAVRYWCAAADGHPMLPAVITLFFATIQLGIYVVDGGLPVLSPPLAFAIGVGGPLGLAGIGIAELWLHNTAGVSIRELP